MADWEDWLTGISGGLSGIVKGIDAGMAPFSTWEGIRTKDLANDRTEFGNRDLELMQAAREGNTDYEYYGNLIGAQDVGNRLKMSKGESDIFGIDQQFQMQQYLNDPNGEFQQRMRMEGLTPDMPEYRRAVSAAQAQFDALGAIGANDKMGIPGIENRNMNQQAALSFLQDYVRQKDADARVVRNTDGTVSIIGGDGTETPVPPDQMVKLYDRIAGAGGVAGAEDRGIKEMIAIQAANAQMMKAMQEGRIDPKQVFNHLNSEGVRINQEANRVSGVLRNLENTKTDMMDESQKAALQVQIEEKRAEVAQLKALFNRNLQSLNSVIRGGGTPGSAAYSGRPQGGGGGAPWMMTSPITGMPMTGSSGSSMTTRRGPPSVARGGSRNPAALMSGGAPGGGGGSSGYTPPARLQMDPRTVQGPAGPLGNSSYGRSASFPEPSDDTGGPIYDYNPNMNQQGGLFQNPWQPRAEGGMDLNQLIAMLQAFGVGRA